MRIRYWSSDVCSSDLLMRSLAPSSFEDVAALIALYRPGPMAANMHNDYADRKNGRKPVVYFQHDAEELLGDTYGLMIYQESGMRVDRKSGMSGKRGSIRVDTGVGRSNKKKQKQ